MPHVDTNALTAMGLEATGLGSWVRVRNTSSQDWADRFNGARYLITAGSEVLVPYEALMLWLGDPDARDIDARRRNRTAEFARLRARYGAYDDVTAWAANKPHLEAYTVDGTRITTVVDDPDLESPLLPSSGGVASDDAVAALAEQVRVLTQQLANVTQAPTNPATPSPVAAPFAEESTTGTPIGPLPASDDDSLPEDERPNVPTNEPGVPIPVAPIAPSPSPAPVPKAAAPAGDGAVVVSGKLPVDTPSGRPKVQR